MTRQDHMDRLKAKRQGATGTSTTTTSGATNTASKKSTDKVPVVATTPPPHYSSKKPVVNEPKQQQQQTQKQGGLTKNDKKKIANEKKVHHNQQQSVSSATFATATTTTTTRLTKKQLQQQLPLDVHEQEQLDGETISANPVLLKAAAAKDPSASTSTTAAVMVVVGEKNKPKPLATHKANHHSNTNKKNRLDSRTPLPANLHPPKQQQQQQPPKPTIPFVKKGVIQQSHAGNVSPKKPKSSLVADDVWPQQGTDVLDLMTPGIVKHSVATAPGTKRK